MDADERPDRDAARASLEGIAASRRAAVDATRRPAWVDAGLASTAGVSLPAALLGHWAIGLTILVAGSLALALAQRARTRRRGQVVDERALGARALRFFPLYLVLFVLLQVDPPASWQPWYALAVGVAAGVGGFAWLRWEDRYQARRLVAGDYGRFDLL